MYGYIYETTNLINGKKYIGQHKAKFFEPNKYIGSGILLVKAIEKYGKENFSCKLLEECNSREELNIAEKKWIEKYSASEDRENFYNVARGGEGHTCDPWNKGKHQQLHPNSKAALDYGRHLPSSDKQREVLSKYRNSIVVTDDTKKKLSDQQKGRVCINNGIINTFVKSDMLDFYYSQGWKKGMDKSLVRTKQREEERNRYKNSKRFND